MYFGSLKCMYAFITCMCWCTVLDLNDLRCVLMLKVCTDTQEIENVFLAEILNFNHRSCTGQPKPN